MMAARIIFFGFLFALWFIVTYFNLVNALILPSPIAIANTLADTNVTLGLTRDIMATIARLTVGFACGLAIAFPLGLLIGFNNTLYSVVRGIIDFFRSIPVAALFPLFLIFFGVGEQSKIAATAWSSGLIILVTTILSVRGANKFRQEILRVNGATQYQVVMYSLFPDALVSLMSGLRVAVSIALIVVVMTEMFFGASSGLGFAIYNAAQLYETPLMYLGIILTGLLGYGVNKLLEIFEKRVVHWKGEI